MKKYSRYAILIGSDIFTINLSYILAFLIRFEFKANSDLFGGYFIAYTGSLLILTAIKLLSNLICKLYQDSFYLAGWEQMANVFLAASLGTVATAVFFNLTEQTVLISIYFITILLDMFFFTGSRMIYQFFANMKSIGSFRRLPLRTDDGEESQGTIGQPTKVLLIGLGNTGIALVREINQHPGIGKRIVAAIDDDKSKRNKRIAGVKVVGNRNDIRRVVRRYDIEEIIISIPAINKKAIQEIVNECNKTKCKVKIMPSLLDLVNEKVSVSELRDVEVDDFVNREQISVNQREIEQYLTGKIVLVTGASGAVGAELCRQIVMMKPRKLVALDIDENSIFQMVNEIKVNFPDLEIETSVGSIQDEGYLRELFKTYKPHIVFHSAAYKNILLMESNPKEAIMNNVIGTSLLAEISNEHVVEKFIFISSDKTIKPKSIVGVTKRMAELVVQEKAKSSRTDFLTVRFGNALESSNRILPILRKQISMGGPVTVDNVDSTIYFMELCDTVSLLLQAGAIGSNGQFFDLDMGKPTRLLDLAESVVKLSGYTPGQDIEIKISGLKSDENKYEDYIFDKSILTPTVNANIFIGPAPNPSERIMKFLEVDSRSMVQIVQKIVRPLSNREVKQWLYEMVPEYRRSL